jgi:aminomethyltransferase
MLKTSPLDAEHRSLGAKMGAFAGWDMPISYPPGTIAEHTAVRSTAGLFDVTHLGKILVQGSGAADFLDSQLTNRMDNLGGGRARYTLICNEDAGIIDDLIVYGLGDGEMLVVPNASNRDAVFEVLRTAAPEGVSVEIVDWTTLAVQGPAAPDIVASLYPWAKELGYMKIARDGDVFIARSGYTGERGYEVFTTFTAAVPAWRALLEAVRGAGGEACGLASRDTLRLEMGYPLHGNDISLQRTPAEAGLMWAVALKDREFPGARVLRDTQPKQRLIGLKMTDRLIPRPHCAVLRDGVPVGECTSGTISPMLKVGIALAYVDGGAEPGEELEVDIRGKRGSAQVVDPPFVERSPK